MKPVSTTVTSQPSSLDQVAASLRTDVTDILTGALPALEGMERKAAYESLLNGPEILHDAFQLLRNQPQLFQSVLVDHDGRPVPANDDQKLSCGETLGHIIALALRASARRHFRKILGGPRTVLVQRKQKKGFWRRNLEKLGLIAPLPSQKKRLPGRGDKLYQEIRHYLVHDWQARLIPHYTQFPHEILTELGPSLLEIREPCELRALAGEEGRAALKYSRKPVFLSAASKAIKSGTDTIDAEILIRLWDHMGLDRLFSDDPREARNAVAEISATSTAAINLLLPILGEDIRLFVGFLVIAYCHLGRVEYRAIFTESGATQWMCKRICERLNKVDKLPAPELSQMQAIFQGVLSNPQKNTVTVRTP